MQEIKKRYTTDFSSFEEIEGQQAVHGMNDWAVPWADLMMVMFVLFVVLFIYTSTHQDVRILFSDQSRGKAQDTSTLDPLVGLIGQIAGRMDAAGTQGIVRMADKEVIYRSRTDGVSVIREGSKRVRVTLRGDLFFGPDDEMLKPGSEQYLSEVAEIVRLSVGAVHVVGYASADETAGIDGFTLSTRRAEDVASFLMTQFDIEPRRISITGRGGSHPELPGTSDANQALNRRVEIIITNEN